MDVANTHPEFDITEIGTNEPPGKTTSDMQRLHTREEPKGHSQNNLKKSTTSSQKGNANEAYFMREVPINIDEIHQEDVANYRQIDGVANKEESRGSP